MSTAEPEPVRLDRASDFALDVRAGLDRQGQKELPSKYLYDDIGSALFEVICLLPEYGLTRAGERLLRRFAPALVAEFPAAVSVVDLGSGSGRKTRILLEAFTTRQPTTYYPTDLSRRALERCVRDLAAMPRLTVVDLELPYLDGLARADERRAPGEALLVTFLGSTIGNFERGAAAAFLGDVRARLGPADRLLLETDLMKPPARLLKAYDDRIGVTAAFNLNLLDRINREIGGDFDLTRFRHEARWNESERRIEMHLRSTVTQEVRVEKADLAVTLAAGETIWTESSHRFTAGEIVDLAASAGLTCLAQWIDEDWPFAQTLLAPA